MTISVIKYNEDKIPGWGGIRCYADSLISSINDKSELTKHAMKILPLELKSQDGMIRSEIIPKTTIGFTFAGNLNVALLTYNMLSFCCSNIQRKTLDPKGSMPPSIISVAMLCANILHHYNSNYGAIIKKQANTEIIIFGYCFQTNQFKAFHIYPSFENGTFEVFISDADICNKKFYTIGEGKKLLEEKINTKGGIFSVSLVREIIKERESSNICVGGFLQRAWAGKGYVKLYCDNDEKTMFPSTFCGFNAHGIFLGDTHMIGLPMICAIE